MCYLQMIKTLFDTEPLGLLWRIFCLEFNEKRQLVLLGDGDIMDKLFLETNFKIVH